MWWNKKKPVRILDLDKFEKIADIKQFLVLDNLTTIKLPDGKVFRPKRLSRDNDHG